jgi:hypothetical protein
MVPGNVDLRLQPDLDLPVRTEHMHMRPSFLSREEEKPVSVHTNTVGLILAVYLVR